MEEPCIYIGIGTRVLKPYFVTNEFCEDRFFLSNVLIDLLVNPRPNTFINKGLHKKKKGVNIIPVNSHMYTKLSTQIFSLLTQRPFPTQKSGHKATQII